MKLIKKVVHVDILTDISHGYHKKKIIEDRSESWSQINKHLKNSVSLSERGKYLVISQTVPDWITMRRMWI